MPDLQQFTFAGGVIGPRVQSRRDLAKVQAGLAEALNCVIHAEGPISNRQGTHHAQIMPGPYRLIPFEFNTVQQYALAFGNLWMRVLRNGSYVYEAAKTISAATKADPCVITSTAHGWSNGDEIFINDVYPELSGRNVLVNNVTANTAELQNLDGVDISSASFGTFTAGTGSRVYELTTPYAWADIQLDPSDEQKPGLKVSQSNDVMTITHPSYVTKELTRTDHDAWTLADKKVEPLTTAPTAISVSVGSPTGANTVAYAVTALIDETGEESLRATHTSPQAITGATQADPCVLTIAGARFDPGDEIYVSGVVGMTELNDRRFIVDSVSGSDVTLRDVDAQTYTAYTSGGTAGEAYYEVTNAPDLGSENITVSWTAAAGVDRYNVYKRTNSNFFFIGSTQGASFVDNGIEPDGQTGPPKWRNPFDDPAEYPGCSTYWEQRQAFGGSSGEPQRLELSQAGAFDNFTRSTPGNDADAISRVINSTRANDIRHLVEQGDLLVITAGETRRVWANDTAVTPTSIVTKRQTGEGGSHVHPIQVGERLAYVETGGRRVFDMGYRFENDAYSGNDRTIMVSHYTERRRIQDWDYGDGERIAWTVYDDGTFAAFTYLPEQDVWAWARCATDGEVKGVVAIEDLASGDLDTTVYLAVRRRVGGVWRWYAEYMEPRKFDDPEDAFFLDSGLTLDNPVAVTAYTKTSPVTLTAPGHGLSEGDTIDLAGLLEYVAGEVEPQLIAAANKDGWQAHNISGDDFEVFSSDIVALDAQGWGDYAGGGEVRKAVTKLTGLWHLAGESVVALANGQPVTGLTVTALGELTLLDAASRVHVGRAYDAHFVSLDLEYQDQQGPTADRHKTAARLTLDVEDTQDLQVGRHDGALIRAKNLRGNLHTGKFGESIRNGWSRTARVKVVQSNPLPMTVRGFSVDLAGEDD